MKCQKKIIIGFGTLFLAFFSVLFASPSYAIDDFSLHFSADSFPGATWLCGNDSGRSCSDYNYLIIDQDYSDDFVPSSSISYIGFHLLPGGANMYHPLYLTGSSCVYSLQPDLLTALQYNSQLGLSSYLQSGVSVTVTLTDTIPFTIPSGSISLTSNGSYDVSQYSTAIVDVPPDIVYGDYHDDLVNIKIGIYVCAGTLLVLYFFYCIYRLIIRNSGVK